MAAVDTTCHFDRLPGELLLDIFAALHAVYGHPVSLCWVVRVTHVSRRWRALAVNHGPFWGHIQTHNAEWMRELLRRVKDADVTIGAHLSDRGTEYYAPLLSKASQATIIDLVGTASELEYVITTYLLSADGSRLCQLFLRSMDPNDNIISCPTTIFRGSMPAISQLTLMRVNLDWNSPFIKNLTALNIGCPSNRISLAKVTHVLQTLPTLKHLRLLHAIEHNLPQLAQLPPPTEADLIYLPALEEIFFEGAVTEMAMLLDRIDAPPTARIRLMNASLTLDGRDAFFLVTALARYRGRKLGASALEIKHLILRCNMPAGYGIEVLCWVHEKDKEPFIAIGFNDMSRIPTFNTFGPRGLLSQIVDTLLLSNSVVSIKVTDGSYTTADGRYKFLQKCNLVEQIVVNQACMLLDLLTPSIVSNPIYDGIFPFEKLDIIQTSEEGWKDALPRTVQLLLARHVSDNTLDTFIITGRPTSSQTLFAKVEKDLKQVVGELIVA
ncbi:hypothetical protein AX16_001312 [Volvariella volvacea WC 439]|nr:hypothetical protein AX16_001312 [Volvariella volvacea WC 439]